jgi:hypothetical protein
MTASRIKQNIVPIGLLVISMITISFCNFSTEQEDATRILIPPPKHLEYFSFGYNENVSDSLWLRVIQDIDHCDAGVVKNGQQCVGTPMGWVYQMLAAIADLTPSFRMPYNHGATILSVVVNDREGAKRIFDRGVEQFPKDWSLQYRAAYHYLYEMKDQTKAAELLNLAGKNGAPPWVFALAARLYTAEGQAFLAKSILESVLEDEPDSKYAEQLKGRLTQLNEIIRKEAADAKSGADAKKSKEASKSGRKSKRSGKKAEAAEQTR